MLREVSQFSISHRLSSPILKLSEPLLYKGFNALLLYKGINALLHNISRPAPRQCTIFVVEPFVKQILTYGMLTSTLKLGRIRGPNEVRLVGVENSPKPLVLQSDSGIR